MRSFMGTTSQRQMTDTAMLKRPVWRVNWVTVWKEWDVCIGNSPGLEPPCRRDL